MALAAVTLDDKYALERGRVYLTGTQALVRLPIMQRQRDAAAGLNTACFISGYRGSPLGALTRACGAPGGFSSATTYAFSRQSTKSSARRRFGAVSRSVCSRGPSTTASSPCGTARDPGSTAVATP